MIARGWVVAVRGGLLDVALPSARVGDVVEVHAPEPGFGRVCGVQETLAHVAAYGVLEGVAAGTPVCVRPSHRMALGTCALGRAIDALGRPLDARGPLHGRGVRLEVCAPLPHQRTAVSHPCWTGVKAIDGLLTLGRGARIGIFGAPGTGKSTLLEAIARGARCDALVVALIGERGREARRWIDALDARATVVCATSDRPAPERVAAAWTAMAHAAVLRASGLDVLLIFDSLARFAAAARETACAAGEPTGRGGFPPSVFAELARLSEVAGNVPDGSITLVASVLDDGDERDPISDAARSLLDGHVALSLRHAQAGRFPAIDVTASTSRTMNAVAGAEHRAAAGVVRRAIARLLEIDDARRVGIEPADPATRAAVSCEAALDAFLMQGAEPADPSATLEVMHRLASSLEPSDGHRDVTMLATAPSRRSR